MQFLAHKSSIMKYYFHTAGISVEQGTITINSLEAYRYEKHRNIEVVIEGGIITVKAERLNYACALSEGQFDLTTITDSSIRSYKPWPWSKKLKKKSRRYVELLKRDSVTYTGINYIIIHETR